jgi:transposase
MSKRRVKNAPSASRRGRRSYPDEFKQDAVQMLLDGHTAQSVVERLGLSSVNVLYRWKREQLEQCGPAATSLEARVRELELELHRVERERDILKKALAIFGRHE